MAKNLTDEQLIHSYQKGDAEAFDELYSRYKNAVYHYFFRQVHNTSAADELHQDVWLRIIKSSTDFKLQSGFKTWLYKIAHNRLIDYYRRSSRQPLHLVHNTIVDINHEPDNKYDDSVNQPSEPDEILQEQQVNQALLTALNSLPDEQKEVFLLHERSGLTLQEIAIITDNSFESSKSRLRYAVKKLRQHMTQYLAVER
ncbi:MAG: sigma-70 family RNA polymerase sigma factor [gamma proteobacterium symbiont of Bathyaustriella thionipta]|nr:sigma-70 family RNA polymerase sigma factor [gamma proteobacterium symbiont of Bathyaustriella thionipta]MCU7948445.1 sigma-70 family RNA polymerase sigma factor [gamma proteobacterium symbiont of Bathyaustriella thionipta]MCU7954144.1 sigma-70 family RNA polymerase sigma factor [gamma proteobacterium symbiont of Bathyaustriella thionipta]MCU7955995.1 sigma-70 family RNA polymerase sigma factor [gamma proteobacterium symbiont of Bathyaustriella thionipta]MCU7967438.1 sigma-70 family RNA poly